MSSRGACLSRRCGARRAWMSRYGREVSDVVVVRRAETGDLDRLVELWEGLARAGNAADDRYAVRADGPQIARRVIAERWLDDGDDLVVLVAAIDPAGVVGFITA